MQILLTALDGYLKIGQPSQPIRQARFLFANIVIVRNTKEVHCFKTMTKVRRVATNIETNLLTKAPPRSVGPMCVPTVIQEFTRFGLGDNGFKNSFRTKFFHAFVHEFDIHGKFESQLFVRFNDPQPRKRGSFIVRTSSPKKFFVLFRQDKRCGAE